MMATRSLRHVLREGWAGVSRTLPRFRGWGRATIWIDRWLTAAEDDSSYLAVGRVNDDTLLKLDLRTYEQKFAFYYGKWEDDLIGTVRKYRGAGMFYDVGASMGLYTIKFARLANLAQGEGIRAFEPVPTNRQRLEENLSLNRIDSSAVAIEPIALGAEEGEVRLTLCEKGRAGNAKISSEGEFAVRQTLLDQVWREHDRERVGFIKIDTEGWDVRVLEGAREVIAAQHPNLLVEFNRERMRNLGFSIEPTWKFLIDEQGYRCFRLDDHGHEVPVQEPKDWENLFFVA